ncbi:aconitase X [Rhizobium halophytocola]|uniref:Aconitase/putative aconitase with swiveling domain n=1 Tax=Rhizobium halophytocola TaxID=735519 RepID=A0ABS4DVU5_9HYPH|nr:aconitase family protein [Rhizobium halophytocola]MBP1849785.1 putative aconitase/putative aconitase with swiveling domain [Rhizobium halophytocola]
MDSTDGKDRATEGFSVAARMLVEASACGRLLVTDTALSFWGGVDPETGVVIDRSHPLHGQPIAGRILAMPAGRGSCTGSAVLLQLILNGKAPAGLVFAAAEEILTLGVIVAEEVYGHVLPVAVVSREDFARLPDGLEVTVAAGRLVAGGAAPADRSVLPGTVKAAVTLTEEDRRLLSGDVAPAVRMAMRIVVRMAELLAAERLIDVAGVHVDGCIYTGPAGLDFAERLAEGGGRVVVPTTLNAISVDRDGWQAMGADAERSAAASRQADAYLRMGAQPTFTCAPYLLEAVPGRGQDIAWAESNAVVYANSVLGARTMKYPDFLDICIALTGRAPLAGCHIAENRLARRIIAVRVPDGIDEAFWPLLGYCVGQLSPDAIPLVTGLEGLEPGRDDLKAFGAAFATTSAAPLFHLLGITPEAGSVPEATGGMSCPARSVGRADLAAIWQGFNSGPADHVDLVALGNPHFSVDECRALAQRLEGQTRHRQVALTITLGRESHRVLAAEGVAARLESFGATFVRDACWCTVDRPVVPVAARVILTNSGKYAHYGPGLTGKPVRFGSLADCVETLVSGRAPLDGPAWLAAPQGGA